MHTENKKELALEVIRRLKQAYPDAACSLDYNEAWKLLVSVRLAAQCTDARVNVVVEDLYAKYPDIDALANATPEEIEEALNHRKEGEHVIPLPAVEVRKDYWLSSIVGFFSKKDTKTDNDRSTIVRPKFSQLGTLIIADSVIEEIVRHCIRKYSELDGNVKVSVFNRGYGVNIYCEMKIHYGVHIQPVVEACQKELVNVLDDITGINVLKIDMRISGIVS